MFPFKLDNVPEKENKIYTACTKDFLSNDRFWCSTKTDVDSNHLKGHWGYCDNAACPYE